MSEDLREKQRADSLSDEEKTELARKIHKKIREEEEAIAALKRKDAKKERDEMIRDECRKGWWK